MLCRNTLFRPARISGSKVEIIVSANKTEEKTRVGVFKQLEPDDKEVEIFTALDNRDQELCEH